MPPRVSVLIVNFRTYDETDRCLESLRSASFATECIVVDHGSDEPALARLRRVHPDVRFVATAGNPGFGAGINRAAALTRGGNRAPSARKRVLVVEDSDDIRETMRLLLTRWGHEVAIAASGEEGLAQLERACPDVAIIDIGLPGISGYEVARRIRAMPGATAVRLIALTGYGQPGDGRRARESGFDEHLLKPLAPELLRATVAGG